MHSPRIQQTGSPGLSLLINIYQIPLSLAVKTYLTTSLRKDDTLLRSVHA